MLSRSRNLEVGSMGVVVCLYVYDVVLKKFTFAISSPDEFLSTCGTLHFMRPAGHTPVTWRRPDPTGNRRRSIRPVSISAAEAKKDRRRRRQNIMVRVPPRPGTFVLFQFLLNSIFNWIILLSVGRLGWVRLGLWFSSSWTRQIWRWNTTTVRPLIYQRMHHINRPLEVM